MQRMEEPCFKANGRRFIERVVGRFAKLPEDEVSTDCNHVMNLCRTIVTETGFNKVLDFLEIVIDEHGKSTEFANVIESLFKLRR